MEEFIVGEKQMKRELVNDKIGEKKSSRIRHRKAKLWKDGKEIKSHRR